MNFIPQTTELNSELTRKEQAYYRLFMLVLWSDLLYSIYRIVKSWKENNGAD